jgi:hypothetical protein
VKTKWTPPSNWPAIPPGWSPPPGWQPDPSWPEPPVAHQFWQPDYDAKPWYRRSVKVSVDNRRFNIAFGAIVAVAAAVVLVSVIAIANRGPHYRNLRPALLDSTISKGIDQQIAENGDASTATVNCPSGQPARPGYKFVCHVRATDGSSGAVKVTVLNKAGDIQWLLENGS